MANKTIRQSSDLGSRGQSWILPPLPPRTTSATSTSFPMLFTSFQICYHRFWERKVWEGGRRLSCILPPTRPSPNYSPPPVYGSPREQTPPPKTPIKRATIGCFGPFQLFWHWAMFCCPAFYFWYFSPGEGMNSDIGREVVGYKRERENDFVLSEWGRRFSAKNMSDYSKKVQPSGRSWTYLESWPWPSREKPELIAELKIRQGFGAANN